MALGRKTGGRQKGSRNKFAMGVKEAFQRAFEAIGSADGLSAWASENRTEFYRLYSKLIPTEIVGPGDEGQHKIEITLNFK